MIGIAIPAACFCGLYARMDVRAVRNRRGQLLYLEVRCPDCHGWRKGRIITRRV